MAFVAQHRAARHNPLWLSLVKFLVLVASIVILFSMCESMVHHHFFDGGVLNNRISTPPAQQE